MTTCTICDLLCDSGYSVPVYNGEVSANSDGNQAACRRCYLLACGILAQSAMAHKPIPFAYIRKVISEAPDAQFIREFLIEWQRKNDLEEQVVGSIRRLYL